MPLSTRSALGPLSPNVVGSDAKPSKLNGPSKAWRKSSKELPAPSCLPPPVAQSPKSRLHPAKSDPQDARATTVSPTTAARVAIGYLASSAALSKTHDMAGLEASLFEAEVRCMNERRACNDACKRATLLTEKLEQARQASEASRAEVARVQRELCDALETQQQLMTRLEAAQAAGDQVLGLHEALGASQRAEEALRTRLAEVRAATGHRLRCLCLPP